MYSLIVSRLLTPDFRKNINKQQLNKKHTSNKIKRHTNKHPGKPIYFPCSKKHSPDQTRNSNIGEGLVTSLHP